METSEKIVSFFLRKTAPNDLLAAAKNLDPKKQNENLCESYFYLGRQALLRGNQSEAIKLFKAAVDICAPNFVEYAGAQAELARLK